MATYLIDVFTRKNEIMLSNLIRPVSDQDNADDISRVEWQLEMADYDVNMSDLISVAFYTKNMESLEKYKNGVAYYDGENIADKIEKLLILISTGNNRLAGWSIKTYVVPVITRAFILAGKDLEIIDDVFNTYPFENRETVDLDNLYNFNGQMSTVRARNRYSLEETAYAYGVIDSIGDDIRNPEETLRYRIMLQKELFNLRGLAW